MNIRELFAKLYELFTNLSNIFCKVLYHMLIFNGKNLMSVPYTPNKVHYIVLTHIYIVAAHFVASSMCLTFHYHYPLTDCSVLSVGLGNTDMTE